MSLKTYFATLCLLLLSLMPLSFALKKGQGRPSHDRPSSRLKLAPTSYPAYWLKSNTPGCVGQAKKTLLNLAYNHPEEFIKTVDSTLLDLLYQKLNPYAMKAFVDLLLGGSDEVNQALLPKVQEHLTSLVAPQKEHITNQTEDIKKACNAYIATSIVHSSSSILGIVLLSSLPFFAFTGPLLIVSGTIGGSMMAWSAWHHRAFYQQHQRLCTYINKPSEGLV